MMLERRGVPGVLALAGSVMTIAVMLMPWMAAASALQAQPALHLTPPQPELLRRNDSVVADDDQQPAEEMQQEESRALEWTIPIPRGRNQDRCNPCDKEPWVPMARALSLDSEYALSVPAVPIPLPVSYGIPVTSLKRPSPQFGSSAEHPPSAAKNQYGPSLSVPPSSQYGPPQNNPQLKQYGAPQQILPSIQHGPSHSSLPPLQYEPQQNTSPNQYGHPQQNLPSNQYLVSQQSPSPGHVPYPTPQSAPPSFSQYSSPASSYARDNTHQIPDNQHGLPPPPLPQGFNTPLKTYGLPKPLTQHVSASNPKPQTLISPLNYQKLPNVKFGPPFHAKPQQNPNVSKTLENYLHPTGPPQNYRFHQRPIIKSPVLVGQPIPFPSMSKIPLPPLYDYQPFHDGKSELSPYLQPPKQHNVVVTITETEDDCKTCKEQEQLKDSEPAPAEHVTENIANPTTIHALENQKPSVQVVKSVTLAEYLASIEYPMQIIQAPILDVPDLTKYWDLGYHSFPQVPNQQGNSLKPQDQNQAPSAALPNDQIAVYLNHNIKNHTTSLQEPTRLDNVNLPEEHTQNTNSLPYNHKPSEDILKQPLSGTTEKTFTSSPLLQDSTISSKSTQGSHISHISKVTRPESARQTTTESVTSQGHSSSSTGHFVTSQPLVGMTEMQPPKTDAPMSFNSDVVQSSTQDHPTTPAGLANHPGLSHLRFLNPSILGTGAISDWSLHPYGRGWGSTLPQPFVMPTAAPQGPQKARFEIRPSPMPSSKKPKHIHQIIVPYTTNKLSSSLAQESGNSLGWTPLPPTNQGRKVPTGINFADQFPSTTGVGQPYIQHFPTGEANIPFSASASDNSDSLKVVPLSNGHTLNLPPHFINQILQRNPNTGIVTWPSGPDNLQQILSTNLQSLLRGEEDSVDFARLQKNIDNWTAEGYKQNSPSVNFIPVTDITHVYNSKKIPDEYLTATEPTRPLNSSKEEPYNYYQHKSERDEEGAASTRHQVKVPIHVKDEEFPDDTIEGLLNSWSLLDTKMSSPSSSAAPETTSETASTLKVWEKVQVSISPLTHEKVYVVTPVSVLEATTTERPESDQLHHTAS